MRKAFSLVFSVFITFALATGAQAKTITIDFDNNFTVGDSLSDQYKNEGITFYTEGGESPAVIASPSISSSGYVLQPNSTSETFYIYLDYALLSFSCLKWEPSGSSDIGTVYWAFMADDDPSVTISNSVKGEWVNVSRTFAADEKIFAIKIWGENIPEGMSYYLDQLIFELDAPSSAVPEPVTSLLLGLGLMGLAAARKRLQV